MIILGIESTCDETGVGIVRDGRDLLANIVSSSAALQKKYKGVVPEIAAREQVRCIITAVVAAIEEAAKISKKNIDAIAVAYGPGLVGSLLVGVETAKTLALVWNKPLIAVNHLMGHVYANWLTVKSSQLTERKNSEPQFPLVALIVSGGHTDLILMADHGKYRWLGGTRDDAAGEAFDKVARLLGLGYPGGPEIERISRSYKSQVISYKLPRPMIGSPDFDFSFSGIKTAVVNLVSSRRYSSSESKGRVEKFKRVSSSLDFARDKLARTINSNQISAIAHEFQNAITDVLLAKTLKAARKFNAKSIVVGGGVAANSVLRWQLTVHSLRIGIPVFFPSKELSVDNGAMIASAAFFQKKFANPLNLTVSPSLHFT